MNENVMIKEINGKYYIYECINGDWLPVLNPETGRRHPVFISIKEAENWLNWLEGRV